MLPATTPAAGRLRLIYGNRARHTAQEVIKRFDKAFSNRHTFESHFQEVYRYFLPQRDLYTYRGDSTPGQRKNLQIFDSTPVRASYKFAGKVMQTLFPPFRRWVKLEAGSDIDPTQRDKIDEILEEEVTPVLFDYLDQSNLATEGHEACLDLVVSVGSMTVQDSGSSNILQFQAVPLYQLVLEEGPWGTIETVFRNRKLSVRNIRREWPRGQLGPTLERLLRESPDTQQEIIEANIYNPDDRSNSYLCVAKGEEHVIYEEELDQSPWINFRWSKVPGEVYGRGPAMEVLPAAKSLNRVTELVLRNAALAISGAWLGLTDGLLNPHTARIRPGRIIPVRKPNALEPLKSSHDFDVSALVTKELREEIREAMLAKDMGPVDAPNKTATEWLLRQQEALRDNGSNFGRLQQELVASIIEKSVGLLQSRGKLPDFRVDGREVRVRYVSTLSRAQDEEDVAVWQQLWQDVLALGPEIANLGIKTEAVPEYLAKLRGIPTKLVRSEQEREKLQQMVAKMANTGNQLNATDAQQQAAASQQQPGQIAA